MALHTILTERFSDGELRGLTFNLGLDYEHLPGQTKADKARELILYMERCYQLPDLVGVVKEDCPAAEL